MVSEKKQQSGELLTCLLIICFNKQKEGFFFKQQREVVGKPNQAVFLFKFFFSFAEVIKLTMLTPRVFKI